MHRIGEGRAWIQHLFYEPTPSEKRSGMARVVNETHPLVYLRKELTTPAFAFPVDGVTDPGGMED